MERRLATSSYNLKLLALAGFDMVEDPDWMVNVTFSGRQVFVTRRNSWSARHAAGLSVRGRIDAKSTLPT